MRRSTFALTLALAIAPSACARPAGVRRASAPATFRVPAERSVLRRGTLLVARLDGPLGTDVSRAGDVYSARIVNRVVDPRGRALLPEGARVIGRVTTVEKGRGEMPPRLALSAERLRAGGRDRAIDARVTLTESESANRRRPGEPLRSATIGGVFFGSLLLGLPGALLGGVVGVGGGAAAHASALVVDERLAAGSRIVVELEAPPR